MSRQAFPAAILALGVTMSYGCYVVVDHLRDRDTRAETAQALTGGNADRAPPLFRRYGCSGCHTIPGIAGANGRTGPPLTDMAERVYIAGILENRTDNLVAWIVAPERLSPRTAMPTTGISERETRDLVAYLYAQ